MAFLRTCARVFAGIIVTVFCGCAVCYAAFVVPDKPSSYVSDYAALMSQESKNLLEQKLATFTASTTNEIAVVIIPSLDGDTIEHFANTVFTTWKIGSKKNDNGVLLIIARDDRRARIEVGYGLEGALPDILASQILVDKLLPAFKVGKFDDGVIDVVDSIILATRGEYQAPVKTMSNTTGTFDTLFILGVIIIQGLAFFASILARSKSWWAGGVVGGILGLLATFFHVFGITFLVGVVVTIFLSIFGLLFDYLVSSAYRNSRSSGGSIPWWAGGNTGSGWRGSSGGGSSFGGFGGGRSGGGGASTSW
jgi:uncharacterized protein